MTESVVLVAAGGLAREVAEAAEATGRQRVIGLLDDDVRLHGSEVGGAPVLGGIQQAQDLVGVQFVVCAGAGTARRRIVERLSHLGIDQQRFASVIHPTAVLPRSSRIGSGSIVLANVTLTADVVVGDHVVLMPQVVLTHDNRVDDFATLCAGVVLGGGVWIGSGAYLGMSAAVRQGLRVGAQATVGMGAVLLLDVPAGETWAGVPAVKLFHKTATDSDEKEICHDGRDDIPTLQATERDIAI